MVTDRVTLLEGPPFATELIPFVDKYHTTKFPTVFRDSKIPARKVSFSTKPTKSTSPRPYSWATTVQNGQVNPEARQSRAPTPPPVYAVPGIPRNSMGHRVDLPIKASELRVNAAKKEKICNTYGILGYCPFLKCDYPHQKLDEPARAARRVVARQLPCGSGLYCDDEECFSGHKCPFKFCDINICRFPFEMHDVDQRVVNQ